MHFNTPTKVQQAIIPLALEGKDVIVKSQTGSGKTAAFAIPICERINWDENKPQALILTPTRELAMQVKEDFFNIGRFKRMKVMALYGKSPFHIQQTGLKQKTHIVVGTPGRVQDHLDKGTFITDEIRYLVIDEADEMLRMGFIDQVESIIKALPKERVTMLFSATMKPHIEKLCESYMINPVTVEIESTNLTADRVEQVYYKVEDRDKMQALEAITTVESPESCMIFCNRKEGVDSVYEELKQLGYPCVKIHGGMEQKDRFAVMEDFRNGRFRYLVATDVAARGLDIDDVEMVFNYDVPNHEEFYVHRIGRTGRAGRLGTAITMTSPKEFYALKDIMSYTKMNITQEQIPSIKQLKKARTEKLMEDLKSTISEIDMDKYASVLQEFEEEGITPVELAAVLLKNNLAFMDKEDVDMTPQRRQRNRTEGSRTQSRGGNREDVCRLFINIGKSKGVEPRDFVKFIAENGKIKGRVIGNIDIYDNYTFVNIPKEYEGNIVNALSKKKIKGCNINVEIAQNKPRERKRR